MRLDFSFLEDNVDTAAKRLLGCDLERIFPDGAISRVRIVEVESYDQADAASHSYRGRTQRTDVMFGPSGYLYVYFTYGMHFCCNIVTGPEGNGAAVLIRAVEPLAGENILRLHRHKNGTDLTNGPAKLCQALNIDKHLNGHDLRSAPLQLLVNPPLAPSLIAIGRRIGIRQAQDALRRFYVAGNPYVSRP